MATVAKKSTQGLNDLIQINNDRIEGYERALKEIKEPSDADLKTLFKSMIDESRKIKLALAQEVQQQGENSDQGTTTSGKIYRAWMDVKAVFTGHDRKAILENCEFGENAAQKAYTAALKSDELPAFISSLLTEQKAILRKSHDKIKALRDNVSKN